MAETHYPHAGAHGDEAAKPGHETSDINIRGVFAFGAALFATAVFVHFFVWLLFIFFNGRETTRVAPQYPLAVGQEQRLPPEPRLQTNPREDLRELRANEDTLLNGYSWVDKNKGIVRIPIRQAMKLTIERGLPVRRDTSK